ncbi:Predicted protein [Taphrina deformans PYCC 5710]|uniref:Uncharacterized protein n=1 Tax=Taphrina deformans (strain PYCC 5710 / ATCC 11124 / CBS 356.35 / IMI 108563 / JCM 9778 / NBRC 8474) TaxID=1097556 RepID=R4XC51_TAPDE|nr:Predicted protein [Taphrina deformans PYCC 5710]|eukprot:CCG80915.1 Predicted protein [Taphrina deformans PYCC 5710]
MVAQLLVDASNLTISSIDITECEEATFTMSMRSRITNTGPLAAHIDAMTVSMFAELPSSYTDPSQTSTLGAFAAVRLPALSIDPKGTDCIVTGQHITIKNAAQFDTFNRNLINQSELPVHISGSSTIRVMGLSCAVRYNKTVLLKGMEGLQITVLQTRRQSRNGNVSGIEVDVEVLNRSCVAMDMGRVHVGIHHESVVIAQLQASLRLLPGLNRVTWQGRMNVGGLLKSPKVGSAFLRRDLQGEKVGAVVVGERGEQTRWIDAVVKEMASPITMDSTLRDIYNSAK